MTRDDEILSEWKDDVDWVNLRTQDLLNLMRSVREDEREQCAKVAIEATRIPDDAIRRGTGVRDRIVIEGENIAFAIRNRKERPIVRR